MPHMTLDPEATDPFLELRALAKRAAGLALASSADRGAADALDAALETWVARARTPREDAPERWGELVRDLEERLLAAPPELRHEAVRWEAGSLQSASAGEGRRPRRAPARLVPYALLRRLKLEEARAFGARSESRYRAIVAAGGACDCAARARADYYVGRPNGPLERTRSSACDTVWRCAACGASWAEEQIADDGGSFSDWSLLAAEAQS